MRPVPALGPGRCRAAERPTSADTTPTSDAAKPIGTQFSSHLPIASRALSVSNLYYSRKDAYLLWPTLGERLRSVPTPRDELITCYPTRSVVPFDLWRSTLATAVGAIDLAVAHPLFLVDAVRDRRQGRVGGPGPDRRPRRHFPGDAGGRLPLAPGRAGRPAR
ncbi:predicted protein [Streptomyces pristinaespiralis ATCC 25486]|uniref:Predicted protein n=1 Tax=Streptomyces pristinaespiralis (strain ATCC 25486 / DSM 40338 / CBS 914.69 / JCM 4507 / KCC S-0507 / NBRC 13074 / NRRL 2958 / 5647) TaxID=457429 RepID=D6X749_STRE2|nr:predicted protein [Streptomyces pristinaespiralis ATCC 25486]